MRVTPQRPRITPVALDRALQLTGLMLDVPVVCLSLVNAERGLFVSSYGEPETIALLMSWPFMRRVVASHGPLLIGDGRADPMIRGIPAVRDGAVVAYMGMPLVAPTGRAVGTLSVVDRKPRSWSARQLAFLRRLAAWIVSRMEQAPGQTC